MCCHITFLSYANCLAKLNLKSLEYWHCLAFDLILVYKIYYNLTDIVFEDYFHMMNAITDYVIIV